MNSHTRYMLSFVFVALLAFFVGCDDDASPDPTDPGDETATLTVALTDASDVMFESATIEVGEISVTREGGPAVLLAEDAGTHDLLELQNGVMVDLATVDVEPGRYLQLRLEVLSAEVTLAEGFEFEDGSQTAELTVPSGAQSGIKVNLSAADGGSSAGIEIPEGESVLVVDVDVSQNFVVQGPTNDPLSIRSVQFTPHLRATLEDVSGSIAGTVTYESATPDEETERATVTAVFDSGADDEEMQTSEVSVTVGEDGAYKLWFLAPGEYEVSAAATIDDTEYTDGPEIVTVGEGEDVTGVDFTL